MTTVGHLAPSNSNGTVLVKVPACNNYGLYNIECQLDKSTLAQFYSALDIVVCCIILIAYAWLKFFESEEERNLNSNTGGSRLSLLSPPLPSLLFSSLVFFALSSGCLDVHDNGLQPPSGCDGGGADRPLQRPHSDELPPPERHHHQQQQRGLLHRGGVPRFRQRGGDRRVHQKRRHRPLEGHSRPCP